MKISLLITLCCVLFLSDGVLAEEDNEIKRGHYPFVAFIYYPDETVVEATGAGSRFLRARFLRGAVLVKPEWLISSTVVPMTANDAQISFPRKTLMARLGAISIDAKFTLNEDEDEQEREVIQIVRPYNHSATQWWRDDISLLKTLLPFNMTSAVGTATIRSKPGITNGNCFMLIFATRFGNMTDDRILMPLYVELQPSSMEICGLLFNEETMLCAIDSDENKNAVYSPEYCQGNSGGPLVCENEVAGIQTYIDNNCKQPHFYQLLAAWDNFITCGIEDKCNEENCGHMCMLINKDEPLSEETTTQARMDFVSADSTTVTEEITIPVHSTSDIVTEEDDSVTQPPTLTTATEQLMTVGTTTTTIATTMITTTTTTTTTTTEASTLSSSEETEETSWPKEKYPERMKSFEEDENKIERQTSVEAQSQQLKVKKTSGAADRNMCMFESLFTMCILVSLM